MNRSPVPLAKMQTRAQERPTPLPTASPALHQRLLDTERFGALVLALHTHSGLQGVLQSAAIGALEIARAERSHLWSLPGGGGLTLASVAPADAHCAGEHAPAGSLAAACIGGGTALQYSEEQAPAEMRSLAAAFQGDEPGAMLAVPLTRNGEVLGALETFRSRGASPFTEGELRRLETWAAQVAVAVHNAQMTIRLRDAQAEVLTANAELERKVDLRTQQISRAKEEWERTFDAIGDPIALQEGFTLRRVNRAYAEAVGRPITSIPGKTCHELLAGRDAPCPGCPLALDRGVELTGEVDLPGDRTFHFSGFWLGDARDGRVVVHYQDRTRQRSLEAQLRASERMVALGQLANGAAHEINNPIGFVISNLRSLEDNLRDLEENADLIEKAARLCGQGNPADAVRALSQLQVRELSADGLEIIHDSLEGAHRVAAIVKGLRELSRQEIGRTELADLNACVSRAIRAEFGDDLGRVELAAETRRLVKAAPLHLDHAIGHVLRNARQAVADEDAIQVRTRDLGAEVLVEVEDHGTGIASEHLHRIFEPFFSTRGVGQGVGLGLTVAWGVVQRCGGRIDVASQPEKGSIFTLRFPAATPEPDTTPAG